MKSGTENRFASPDIVLPSFIHRDHGDVLFIEAHSNNVNGEDLRVLGEFAQFEGLGKMAPHSLPIDALAVREDLHRFGERSPDVLLADDGQSRGPDLGYPAAHRPRALVTEERVLPPGFVVDTGSEALVG